MLLRYRGGARGVMTVSQMSAGRKNRTYYEIDGAQSAIAWDGERPNELWIGHRDRPNETLLKSPALLAPEAGAIASYPGGHTKASLTHSSNSIALSTATSTQVISRLRRHFRPSPMGTCRSV